MRRNLSPSPFFLFLLCLHVAFTARGQYVRSSIISSQSWKDSGRLQLEKDVHWLLHEKDLHFDIEVTLSEAYHGCVKEVQYQRLIHDPTCQIVSCPYCKSKGIIQTKTIDKQRGVEQHLQSPCPVCLGRLKTGKDQCKMYKEQIEKVTFDIPKGARLGYSVKYPAKGNAMLDLTSSTNFSFHEGDLYLTIKKVSDPTQMGYDMTSEGLELNVRMTPSEALEGFKREFKYFNGNLIRINKENKTTLPDTTIRISDDNLQGKNGEEDGLLIRFMLPTIEELATKYAEEVAAADSKQESVVITSQEDFESWQRSKKDKKMAFRRDTIIVQLLHDIKKKQDNDEPFYDDIDEDEQSEPP